MTTATARQWYLVGEASAIPFREGRRVRFRDYEVALFHLEGEYVAIDNRCPHRQGPLADGIISGRAVFCPLHNLKVSLDTGCALSGGAGQVRCYPVRVFQGKLYIAFEEGAVRSEPLQAPVAAPHQDLAPAFASPQQDVNA